MNVLFSGCHYCERKFRETMLKQCSGRCSPISIALVRQPSPAPWPSRLVAVWRFHCIKKEGSFPPLWLPRSRPSRPLGTAGRGRVVRAGWTESGRWKMKRVAQVLVVCCQVQLRRYCPSWKCCNTSSYSNSPGELHFVLLLVLFILSRCCGQWYATGFYWFKKNYPVFRLVYVHLFMFVFLLLFATSWCEQSV